MSPFIQQKKKKNSVCQNDKNALLVRVVCVGQHCTCALKGIVAKRKRSKKWGYVCAAKCKLSPFFFFTFYRMPHTFYENVESKINEGHRMVPVHFYSQFALQSNTCRKSRSLARFNFLHIYMGQMIKSLLLATKW